MGKFSEELQKQLGLSDAETAELEAKRSQEQERIEQTGAGIQRFGCALFLVGLLAMVFYALTNA